VREKQIGDWRKTLLAAVEWLDHRLDRLKLYLKLRRGWLGPVDVVPYAGHGTRQRMRLTGRVLEEKKLRLPAADDPAWRNLRAMIKRFLSAEVPGARVRARFGEEDRVAVADDEGFFDVCLEPRSPLPEDRIWHPVELNLLWPAGTEQKKVSGTGRVLVPSPAAEYGVISDIDDTVVRTEATSLLRMLRLTLFSNAHTRLPFEGVAAFYRALHDGPDAPNGAAGNPIFYVSTGPWNLYDLLEDFLELQDIPAGPIFLKDWGGIKDVLRGMNHRRHKLEVIRDILDTHAPLPFVLIGDSGQQDAETYGQISREYPDRVRAVYIRDIRKKRRVRAVCDIAEEVGSRGVPMLLVDDTVEAAEHAANHGLIHEDRLPEIREEREEDAGEDPWARTRLH
jgi:phosphatidate phosphatase APP1